MSNLSTLPKGDSAWLLRKAIERIIDQVSVLETNIGVSTSGNSADTQIIFNDAGTLRGDAGLVYNKTTDALTVAGLVTAGSATITGDLTVDTNVLKVDTTLNRVGVNNATPSFPLDLSGIGSNTLFRLVGNLGTNIRFDTIRSFVSNRNWIVGCDEIGEGIFAIVPSTALGGSTFTNPVYKVSYDGIHTFLDGAGGTRMTLNSTGLGIGAAPEGRLNVANTATPVIFSMTLVGAQRWQQIIDTIAGNWTLRDQSGSIDALIVKAGSGNVGIGVTPAGTGGCLQLKSGVTFPATQVASADANTLDDYEEGTFLPTVIGTTTAGTIGTYFAQTGRYTKVGKLVTVQVYLAYNGGTGTGNLAFAGLPFTILNAGNEFAVAAIGQFDTIALTALNVPAVFGAPNTTRFNLYQFPTGGGVTVEVPYDAAGAIMFTSTYFTA